MKQPLKTSSDAEEFPLREIPLREKRSNLIRQVITLALPSLVEHFLVMLVQMVDMIQVGGLGPWAIAAVGLANQPMFLVFSVFMGLSVGTTALVARFTGAGASKQKTSAVVMQSLLITLAGAALLAVAAYIAAPWIFRLMGAEADTLAPATTYFQIVMSGLIFTTAALVLAAALRGAGDTKTPMMVNSIANLINILGNWLLINGIWIFPRWEVAGAAAATTFSRAVACLILIGLLVRGKHRIHLPFRGQFKLDWDIVGRVLKVGFPTALEQLVFRSGQVVFVTIVASFGTLVMAAHQVAIQIESLAFMPALAFQIAATTMVGQALGARKPALAETSGWVTLRLAMGFMVFLSFLFFFGGKYIVLLFTSDPQVIALGARVLKIIAFAQPGLATHFILSGALRGAGDTRFALIATLSGIWLVRIGFGYILAVSLNLGLSGAWTAMALDMYMRAALILSRYRSGVWKAIKI